MTQVGSSDGLLSDVRLVVNPAHTPTSIQAMRDKRAWLSKGRTLLLTANTYRTHWLDDDGNPAGRRAHQAATAWVDGERMDLAVAAEEPGFRVLTVDVPD
jgi:hypothetical protein